MFARLHVTGRVAYWIRRPIFGSEDFLFGRFLRTFLGSPLFKTSEKARFRCPCQICLNSTFRVLFEAAFCSKTFFDGVFFKPLETAFFLGDFLKNFPWSPFAKSQKMHDLSVFTKFVITRLTEHFLKLLFVAKCCPMFVL